MTKYKILEMFGLNQETISLDRVVHVMIFGVLIGLVIFITYRTAKGSLGGVSVNI